MLRGAYDKKRQKGCLDFEWFVREGARWRRHHERMEDVWWSDGEIRRALKSAGFKKIRCWDAARVRPPAMKSKPGFDSYYLAQK